MNSDFYCQNTCGSADFSIEEWNEVEKRVRSLSKIDQQNILFPKHCNEQCFSCMAIVGERQAKTKSKS
jgi:hypothetical protein